MMQLPNPPLCEHCWKPMQLADSITDGQGNIVAVRYVCGCQTPPHHKNIHAGQS